MTKSPSSPDPIAEVNTDPTIDELYPKVLAKDPRDVTGADRDVLVAKQRADRTLWLDKKDKEEKKKEDKAAGDDD